MASKHKNKLEGDLPGFPLIEAEFRYVLKNTMVLHVEDFYFRRVPLYLSRRDHGLAQAQVFVDIWAEELGKTDAEKKAEYDRLVGEVEKRSAWQRKLQGKMAAVG